MDLKAELLSEHSKRQTMKIVSYIGNDNDLFKVLMDLFFKGPYRVTQRAAWVVGCCADNEPGLIIPYLEPLLKNLQGNVHDAVKRNTVRLLENVDIPGDLLGIAAHTCFRFLNSADEAVAVRVYSMSVLLNICKKEPELKEELRLCIESQLPYASAAFTSRGQKILKKLAKL
jgi:hypothetical protein